MRLPACALVFLSLTACALAQTPPAGPAVGAKTPDFSLRDTSGTAFRLSECSGKQVTVLAFVRVTDPSCRRALTELQKLQHHYGGHGVGIYAVDLEGSSGRRTATARVRELGLQFPVLLDTHSTVAKLYAVTRQPQVAVVDPAGNLQFVQGGYDSEWPAKLTQMIEKYRPAPKLPKLVVIQGAECVNCGPMPAILKEMQTALAGKLEVELHPYNPDLVEKYSLDWAPALLFFDAAGQEVLRHEGPMTRDELVEQLQKMGIAVQ